MFEVDSEEAALMEEFFNSPQCNVLERFLEFQAKQQEEMADSPFSGSVTDILEQQQALGAKKILRNTLPSLKNHIKLTLEK